MENVHEMFVREIVDRVRKLAMNFVILTNSPVVSTAAREKLRAILLN